MRGRPCNHGLQVLSRRGAARIGQNDRAFHDVGLLGVVGRHLHATLGEALVHGGDHVVIAAQVDTQRSGDALAREVVFGGAETSGDR